MPPRRSQNDSVQIGNQNDPEGLKDLSNNNGQCRRIYRLPIFMGRVSWDHFWIYDSSPCFSQPDRNPRTASAAFAATTTTTTTTPTHHTSSYDGST